MSMSAVPASGGITSPMIQCLEQTRPWVRLLSILGFVCTALTVLLAFFMMVVGGAGLMPGSPFGAGGGVMLGLVYLLLSLLYLFPSLFLFRYASGITSMERDIVGGMERALGAQKSFWRFMGIAALVYLVILFVIIAIAIVAGVMGAMRH